MNHKELTINIGGETITVFMQRGFFGVFDVISPLHKHPYTEIQVIASGNAEFSVEDAQILAKENEMIVIPPEVFHQRNVLGCGAKVISFQISRNIDACAVLQLPEKLGDQLLDEVVLYMERGLSNRLELYLALVCSSLFEPFDPAKPIGDRAYLIGEFFSQNYNKDITLGELARMLHLSEKQTERLILCYTGNTFRKELTRRRMEAAQQLMKNEALSLNEIAERVGYRSYSGFWKAFSKK